MSGSNLISRPITFLRDTGATGIIIKSSIADTLPGPRFPSELQLRFANKSIGKALREQVILFQAGSYAGNMRCLVADIQDDFILGTPWDIDAGSTVTDWTQRTLRFRHQNKLHTWRAISYKTPPQPLRTSPRPRPTVMGLTDFMDDLHLDPLTAYGVMFVQSDTEAISLSAADPKPLHSNPADTTLETDESILQHLDPRIRQLITRFHTVSLNRMAPTHAP